MSMDVGGVVVLARVAFDVKRGLHALRIQNADQPGSRLLRPWRRAATSITIALGSFRPLNCPDRIGNVKLKAQLIERVKDRERRTVDQAGAGESLQA